MKESEPPRETPHRITGEDHVRRLWADALSPAARDRDRQRQAVLEGLGWTIHRVWSTSWAKDRKNELDKIEEALKAASAP